MPPVGKSSKIGTDEPALATTAAHSRAQQGRNTSSSGDPSKQLDSLASQLQHETEEKKEAIMNEALGCIFSQLPEVMHRLDGLLTGLGRLAETHYSAEANAGWLDSAQGTSPSSASSVPAKYKFAFDSASQPFPFGPTQTSAENCSSCNLAGLSGKRLLAGVSTASPTRSPSCRGTSPVVPANEELTRLLDELRQIFVTLSQHFVNINLGLSLMFPRTEDNEASNLSLEVLNKLLDLASLDYVSFFESNASGRAALILKVAAYPHFGESRRMLFEYDRNACLELTLIVQGLIAQCGRLYDLLVKNLDTIIN
ncbi:Proteasome activator complex subunit 3 [Tyrophagus putrescentiae]|nr:Proteasome activator complex subunit 3 [Tyrophagus putrescentiae]